MWLFTCNTMLSETVSGPYSRAGEVWQRTSDNVVGKKIARRNQARL